MSRRAKRYTNVAALGGISSSDSDVAAWIVAVGASNTTQAEVNILTTMVVGMKADGSWAKLDRLWIYATGAAGAAAVDLVARSSHTLVSAPTFTANKGYTGDGSTSYINTNFNASTATNYTQNSAFGGVYMQTGDSRNSGFLNYVGVRDATNSSGCSIGRNVGNIFYATNMSGASSPTFVFASQVGFWGAERTASNAQQLYYNSTSSVATNATASVAPANLSTFVLAQNNAGAAMNPSNGTASASAFGASLVMATGFSTRIKTALVALGGSGIFP